MSEIRNKYCIYRFNGPLTLQMHLDLSSLVT